MRRYRRKELNIIGQLINFQHTKFREEIFNYRFSAWSLNDRDQRASLNHVMNTLNGFIYSNGIQMYQGKEYFCYKFQTVNTGYYMIPLEDLDACGVLMKEVIIPTRWALKAKNIEEAEIILEYINTLKLPAGTRRNITNPIDWYLVVENGIYIRATKYPDKFDQVITFQFFIDNIYQKKEITKATAVVNNERVEAPFVLPEAWYIKTTHETNDAIIDWYCNAKGTTRDRLIGSVGNYYGINAGGHYMGLMNSSSEVQHKYGGPAITYQQFLDHVLKKQPEKEIEPFPYETEFSYDEIKSIIGKDIEDYRDEFIELAKTKIND